MGNDNRVAETLRKSKEENLEIKISETDMKNAFDGLISRLDIVRKGSLSLRICD